MKIYAVVSNWEGDHALLERASYPYVLSAFGNIDPRTLPYRPSLIIDSGAFAVWTRNATVDLDSYIYWASELRADWGGDVKVLNLDVIPGSPAQPPTVKERNIAADQSAWNAETMREAGLPVIEVFHRYESTNILEAICIRRRPGELVGFGGLAGRRDTKGKKEFCLAAFSALLSLSGRRDTLIPAHGLGVAGDAPLAALYPWYSVDSSSWISARNFNHFVAPDGRVVWKPAGRPKASPDVAAIYTGRRLRAWQRSMETLSRVWAERGVRFVEEDVIP